MYPMENILPRSFGLFLRVYSIFSSVINYVPRFTYI